MENEFSSNQHFVQYLPLDGLEVEAEFSSSTDFVLDDFFRRCLEQLESPPVPEFG